MAWGQHLSRMRPNSSNEKHSSIEHYSMENAAGDASGDGGRNAGLLLNYIVAARWLWANKEPVFTPTAHSTTIRRPFDRSEEGDLDIAGTRSTQRLQVRYILKNTASVYTITRQTRRTVQLMFDETPAPGLRSGVTTKNKQDDEQVLKKTSGHRIKSDGESMVILAERPGSPCECVCDPSVLFRAGIRIFDGAVRTG